MGPLTPTFPIIWNCLYKYIKIALSEYIRTYWTSIPNYCYKFSTSFIQMFLMQYLVALERKKNLQIQEFSKNLYSLSSFVCSYRVRDAK